MATAAFKVQRVVVGKNAEQETSLVVRLPRGTFLPIVHCFNDRLEPSNDGSVPERFSLQTSSERTALLLRQVVIQYESTHG